MFHLIVTVISVACLLGILLFFPPQSFKSVPVFTVSISIISDMFVSLIMSLSCPFIDHEVHQSAGAGSADRHRGEGTLHLRDGAGQRGLCYKHKGAEQ